MRIPGSFCGVVGFKTSYGRVSTRQHIGFASTQMAIGFARYLRKSGCSRAGMTFYKLMVTLDAPLLLVDKALQYAWRRLLGRKEKAEKSLLALRGVGWNSPLAMYP